MTNNPNSTVVEKLAAAIGVDIKSIAKTLDFYGRPYRVYTALLNQSNTDAPTAVVLENTFPFEPTFVYEDVGFYTMRFPFEIPIDKLFIVYNPTTVELVTVNGMITEIFFSGSGLNVSEIIIYTGTVGGAFTDNQLKNNSVEIRVYY